MPTYEAIITRNQRGKNEEFFTLEKMTFVFQSDDMLTADRTINGVMKDLKIPPEWVDIDISYREVSNVISHGAQE